MTLAGCNKKDEVLPLIESTFCLVKGKTSIYLGSIIHSEGSSQVKNRGVCWDTDSMPTIYNDHTTDGSGGCEFNSRITGLNPGTKYFIRSYARSKIGTSLSVEWSVTTQRDPCAPVVTTSNSSVSAHDGGNISNDGGSLISVHGICFSTASNPTIARSKTINGNGTVSFTSWLTGLNANTTYHVRAYAINEFGTYYGNETTVTILETVADIEGNNYNVALIGSQMWMADNLKTTKY